MLEYSHGEIGWDVFTLRYKVDPPIDTVLDSDTMINYFKVFQYLWKLKRIEGSLSTGWMRIAGGARTFLRVPGASLISHWDVLIPIMIFHYRAWDWMASSPAGACGNDPLPPPGPGLLSARGHRVSMERADGVHKQKGRWPRRSNRGSWGVRQ